MLLGSVGHLNLGVALLRFVPVADGRVRSLVAGCYLVGAVAAAAVGAGFALGAGWWAPDLLEAVGRGGLVAFLAVAAPVWAVFVMQDYVLTALGRAVRVPIANLAFAVAKLVLLALAAVFAIHTGIALSWLVATVLMVAVVSVLVFRLLPARSSGTRVTAGEVARFVRADYAGELCWTAVVFGLPVVVLTRLGPEAAATFGIAWTIAYALYLVPHGMGQAMVAHLAADPGGLAAARRGMVLRAYALLVPAVLVLAVAARPLLAVFGPHYAATGVTVLILAALAALPDVVVRAAVAAARVQRRAAVLVGLPAAVAGMVLAGSWVLAPRLGLVGVGAALLVAETLAAAVVLAADRRRSLGGEPGAQRGQRPRQQPRDVHLRYPHPLPDLGLGEAVEEPQGQDPAVAVRQRRQQRDQGLALLDQVEPRFRPLQRGAEPHAVARPALVVVAGFVQGRAVRGGPCRQAVQHDLEVHPQLGGDLRRSGRPPQPLPEHGGGVVDRRLELP